MQNVLNRDFTLAFHTSRDTDRFFYFCLILIDQYSIFGYSHAYFLKYKFIQVLRHYMSREGGVSQMITLDDVEGGGSLEDPKI